MKQMLPASLKWLCALGLVVVLNSCGSGDDKAKTKELLEKSSQLKMETDQLAAEAAAIQQKIRDNGDEDTTGEKMVQTLLMEEKRVQGEGTSLEKLAADLKLANEVLSKDKAAFTQKYLKP